jgi:hypothetical protein
MTSKLLGSCQDYTFENIREDAQKTSEKIAELTYDSNPDTRLFIPDFAAASKDNLDKYQPETDELYAELKAILDEKAKESQAPLLSVLVSPCGPRFLPAAVRPPPSQTRFLPGPSSAGRSLKEPSAGKIVHRPKPTFSRPIRGTIVRAGSALQIRSIKALPMKIKS